MRKNFIKRVIKHWNWLPWLQSKDMKRWHLWTWFSGGLGSIRLMVELSDFKGLFLPI